MGGLSFFSAPLLTARQLETRCVLFPLNGFRIGTHRGLSASFSDESLDFPGESAAFPDE
jgi:hypothetical protein